MKNEIRPTNLLNESKIIVPIKNPGADPKWFLTDAELTLGFSIQQQRQSSCASSGQLPPVSPHMKSCFFSDYNENSLANNSLSKSIGLFGENGKISDKSFQYSDLLAEIDAVMIDKIVLNRFSDSDDEDDDDSEGEFSSPTIKSAAPQQPDIITSTFPDSLDKEIIPTKEVAQSSRLRSFSAANQNPRDLRQASLYSAEIIGECYEWMWHVGFKGMDPLGLPSATNNKNSQGPYSSLLDSSSMPPR